jgi:uncharacterized membrane protein
MTEEFNHSPLNTIHPPTVVPAQNSALALVSLISGILCWFVAPMVGALVAVITGYMAKKEIRESGGRLIGGEMATAGIVLGYLHLAVTLIGLCIALLIVAGVIAFFLSFPAWWGPYIQISP